MEETGISVVESNMSERKWYHDVTLEDAETFILANMKSAVCSVIAIGYYLKCIRDGEMYLEAGYGTIWEYASAKYGFSKSTATRYMKRNDKFSVDGNSPILAEEYREFSKSQLQEMLVLDEGQLEKVTPDMTVRQIRELKKPSVKEIPYFEIPGQLSISDFPGITQEDVQRAESSAVELENIPVSSSFTMNAQDFFSDQDTAAGLMAAPFVATSQQEVHEPVVEMSVYGTAERVYPPDSLIATEGCEGGHDCFSCSMECNIRKAARYCKQAPMGNPFPCTTMNALELIRNDVGEKCQFINHNLAFHRSGDGEPTPCCRDCGEICGFRCGRSKLPPDQLVDEPEEEITEDLSTESDVIKDYDREILKKMIQEEMETLEVMNEYWRANQPWTYAKHRMKIDAYRMLMDHHDKGQNPEGEEEPQDQPELPVMKNNDQRKEFIRNFHTLPIWFEVEQAGEVYYRYDFEDGSSLVICEYSYYSEWKAKYGFSENPDTKGTREYILIPGYHYLHDCRSNETAMVEHLKKMQKG